MKKDFYWIHKDYNNSSLNNIARRLVEYHTANLIQEYNVHYVYDYQDYENFSEVGRIFLDEDYTVKDTHIINSLVNYNVYFKVNTEEDIKLCESITDLDFIVSLAAGDLKDSKLLKLKRYIIDISPRAIKKSKEFLDVPQSSFYQVDVFDDNQLSEFLKQIKEQTGLMYVSNCFLYIPNCILFDIQHRIEKQNQFLSCLRNDSRTWYVNMISANGDHFYNLNVDNIPEIVLDNRFGVLPWIS